VCIFLLKNVEPSTSNTFLSAALRNGKVSHLWFELFFDCGGDIWVTSSIQEKWMVAHPVAPQSLSSFWVPACGLATLNILQLDGLCYDWMISPLVFLRRRSSFSKKLSNLSFFLTYFPSIDILKDVDPFVTFQVFISSFLNLL